VEVEGKAPGARQLAAVLAPLSGDSLNTLFVDQQSTSAQVQAMMRSMGISVVEINPLADNYPGNIKKIADLISRSLSHGEMK
jgi:zinc transport system substrate-binding protein